MMLYKCYIQCINMQGFFKKRIQRLRWAEHLQVEDNVPARNAKVIGVFNCRTTAEIVTYRSRSELKDCHDWEK